MIVFQERNDEGRRVTAEFYSAFCDSKQRPTPIDRVSFLYGMQAFCCDQLRKELDLAVQALEQDAGSQGVPQPSRIPRSHGRHRAEVTA